MNYSWVYAFLSVSLISLVSLIGVIVIVFNKILTKNRLHYLVAFSVGSMLGGAFFHLLPESLETLNVTTVSTLALAGILTSYCLEILLNWRHCHIPTSEKHPHTFVYMNLVGDGIHNFIDGMVIAGAFQIDNTLGFATSIAIILHEIPQEIGDFGVLVYGGIETRKALLLNLLSGITCIFGCLVSLMMSNHVVAVSRLMIPFALGNFLYISVSDLIPELRDEKELSKGLIQLFYIIAGVLLLYLLRFIE